MCLFSSTTKQPEYVSSRVIQRTIPYLRWPMQFLYWRRSVAAFHGMLVSLLKQTSLILLRGLWTKFCCVSLWDVRSLIWRACGSVHDGKSFPHVVAKGEVDMWRAFPRWGRKSLMRWECPFQTLCFDVPWIGTLNFMLFEKVNQVK